MLIVLESTTYPGTTEEVVQPMLEAGGLKAGDDFFLAFSPERVDPGNPTFNTHNVPKVVGGIDAGVHASSPSRSTARRSRRIVPVSSPRVAEMVKLLENTFRAVNIGLVNELALMCDRLGIDVWEVVDGGGDQAVRLHAVLSRARASAATASRSIRSTCRGRRSRPASIRASSSWPGQINGGMPHFVVDKIGDALNRQQQGDQRIDACWSLGVAYKRDIDDMRESPALDVMALLHQKGAQRPVRRSVRAGARRRARGRAAST